MPPRLLFYIYKGEIRMITGKQRSFLRALANEIDPIFQIGKGGINENMIKQFNEALEARELIKVSVLKNSIIDIREACNESAKYTDSEIVQVIGNKFVLYKESKENKVIELP
jgi:RNA-binding protein